MKHYQDSGAIPRSSDTSPVEFDAKCVPGYSDSLSFNQPQDHTSQSHASSVFKSTNSFEGNDLLAQDEKKVAVKSKPIQKREDKKTRSRVRIWIYLRVMRVPHSV